MTYNPPPGLAPFDSQAGGAEDAGKGTEEWASERLAVDLAPVPLPGAPHLPVVTAAIWGRVFIITLTQQR